MAIVLEIEGTPRAIKDNSLHLSRTANGRATLAVSIRSLDATYRPALDDDVTLEEDTTVIFGGSIKRVVERGVVDGHGVSIINEITAADFNEYADRRIISQEFAGGSLESILTSIATILSIYGVSLDAGQVTGPTLPNLAYTIKTVTEVLNDIMARTAEFGEPFVWEIDATKTLRAFQPSTLSAPFDITGSPPYPVIIGDLTIEKKRESSYANNVTVVVDPISQNFREETFVGDGSEDTFTLTFVPFWFRGLVTNEGVEETLGPGATWEYDPGTNSITRTAGAPANGNDISIIFHGTFTALANANDAGAIAAVGQYDKVIRLDSIPDGTSAQAKADAELALALVTPEVAKYRTREVGVAPGQTQTITVARRSINATAVITDVVSRDLATKELIHEVAATFDDTQTNINRGWRDVYRRWLGSALLPRAAGGVSSTPGGDPTEPGTGGSGGGYSYVVKTADETVNNSNTLQDDNQLAIPVVASAVYEFEVALLHDAASSASDFQFAWSVPSGTTMLWGTFGGDGASFQAGSELTGVEPLYDEGDIDDAPSRDTSASNPCSRLYKGWIFTGANAGNVQLRWAQNVATASDNTILTNSYIKYRRIR